jgi:hypothetical protein
VGPDLQAVWVATDAQVMASCVRLRVMGCSPAMRRLAVLVCMVAATGAATTLYAPSRAQAACATASGPCCDVIINDHYADPACEPQGHSIPAALGIGAVVAAGALLIVLSSLLRVSAGRLAPRRGLPLTTNGTSKVYGWPQLDDSVVGRFDLTY